MVIVGNLDKLVMVVMVVDQEVYSICLKTMDKVVVEPMDVMFLVIAVAVELFLS